MITFLVHSLSFSYNSLTFLDLCFFAIFILLFSIILIVVILSIVIIPVVVIVLIFLPFLIFFFCFLIVLLFHFFFFLVLFLGFVKKCLTFFGLLTLTLDVISLSISHAFIIRLLGRLGLLNISVLLMCLEVDALEFSVVGTAPVAPLNEADDDFVKRKGAIQVFETPDFYCLRDAFNTEIADRSNLPVCLGVMTHIDASLDIDPSGNALLNVCRISHISIIELRLLRLESGVVWDKMVNFCSLPSRHHLQNLRPLHLYLLLRFLCLVLSSFGTGPSSGRLARHPLWLLSNISRFRFAARLLRLTLSSGRRHSRRSS